jgi:hypothetical protein
VATRKIYEEELEVEEAKRLKEESRIAEELEVKEAKRLEEERRRGG